MVYKKIINCNVLCEIIFYRSALLPVGLSNTILATCSSNGPSSGSPRYCVSNG